MIQIKTIYKAHINETTGKIQTVKEHSEQTANLCQEYAIAELKDMMYAIGLAHDIGKYQETFQRRINGENVRVEHSTCGALVAKERYAAPMALLMEYCIAGHHSGIPDGGFLNDTASDNSTLNGRMKRGFEDYSTYETELAFPELDSDAFLRFLMRDCGMNQAALVDKFAFLTRYSFSCLTDADSMDTAEACGREEIRSLHVDFEACLQKLNQKMDSFICRTKLQKTRTLIQTQVYEKAGEDAEIYLMQMPTGSGKSLCSMKFALERVIRTGKKRIIYIIPFNSIIEQTVQVFGDLFGEDAEILRHQSTFSYEDEKNGTEDYREAAKCAVENWGEAPLIVTTAVQFFESIYGNKRGKLRKLHNMADSILIFDEAHLMPVKYLQPCLQAIAYITKYLNSEAVFLTATMPDFPQLLKQYALPNSKIVNLVEDTSLFSVFQKCQYQYVGTVSTEVLLEKAFPYASSLLIVNQKKTARELYQKCGGKKYHLSTYLVSLERTRILQEIKEELRKLEEDYPGYENVPPERRVTIISTSLIEAGVDLDVCTVFRELNGLDNILQAGGRCNREGRRKKGEVMIFELECESSRPAEDERWNITRGLLKKYADISSPACMKEYYDRLFFLKAEEIQRNTISRECEDIRAVPFQTYAETFKLIESYTESVVVPVNERSRKLIEMLRYTGNGNVRELQAYTCSVSRSEWEELKKQHVIADYGTGIFCLTNPDYYDPSLGILFEAKDYCID